VQQKPIFSVIMAAYNRSASMRHSIQSVLAQTCTDFELLVIGDACTDDSEEVAHSFGDRRVKWYNLVARYGSQTGPNNFGLQNARGEYVAYLGHDDLWAPDHLDTALQAFHQRDAEVVVSVAMLYGPAESGVRGVTGLFPNDSYSQRYYVPPSSLLHRRALIETVGLWRSPSQAENTVDYDFAVRLFRGGARFVTTRHLTVFKFHASWRRDSYRKRAADEQERCLRAVLTNLEEFRRSELIALLQCAIEDRFIRAEAPGSARARIDTAARSQQAVIFKGAQDAPVKPLSERTRFFLDEAFSGFEWHSPEEDAVHGFYRWSGPSSQTTISLPVRLDRPAQVGIHIIHVVDDTLLQSMRLTLKGVSLEYTLENMPDRTWLVTCIAPTDPERLQLTINLAHTVRPFDARGSEDRRWLGVAVNWIEVSPIDRSA
jgi:glycosyltransferase involved in cell wall biosynthesis